MAFLFHNQDTSAEKDKENDQELLVFGYHCKLFRDDAKAESIDAGDHLIPWMGDGKIMIDRSVWKLTGSST